MSRLKVPKRFKRVKAGHWEQPVMRNYFLQCCDCGLIHRMNFRVVMDSKSRAHVQLQAFRVKGGKHGK